MFNRLANSSIKKKIAALKPETKRKFLTTGIITVFILLSLLAYNERQGDAVAADKGEPSGKEEFKRLNYDSDVIEKTFQDNLTANLEQETADLAAKDQQRDKEWQEKMRALAALEERLERKIESDPVILSPPVPQYGHGMATVAEAETDKREQPPQPVGMFEPIGGIELNPQKIEEKTENDAGKKKNTVFLPANSFVKATLLHGLSANTTKGGKTITKPLLFRINDLAILPNKVKANLKGCFAGGEGTGNLASERIEARLLVLSCITKDGKGVINQSVKGYAVDGDDGQVGLSAKVTAKMGLHVARSAFAGLIGGIGKGINFSTQQVALTEEGTVRSVMDENNLESIAVSGFGQGLTDGSKELQSFFLQLAEQTLPVLSSGAAKDVTLVFTEGVDLEIKELNL